MSTMRAWLCVVLAATLLASILVIPAGSVTAAESGTEATIYAYQQPFIYSISKDYSVKANGVAVPVVTNTNDYDYATFSMSRGYVTFEVTALGDSSISSYGISPQKLGITGTIEGNKLTFTVPNNEYLILKINNKKRVVIAADPEETDAPKASGEGIFNVTDAGYGARSGKNSDGFDKQNTAAIQKAINDAAAYGTKEKPGIVYVPPGTYFIGNLILRSNTSLYLAPGAGLVSTGKKADYTENWFKNSVNKPVTWWISTEFGSDRIKIYGRGTIDGNGEALSKDKMINNLIVPVATSHFTLDGITTRNSSAWAITPARSNDLTFTNLKMFNSLSMGENDGIDICESQNVVVRHAIGISLDDPFTTKTWAADTDIVAGKTPWPGKPEPVKNVLFEDLISWTICYGFKIGQGMIQDQKNVTFRDGVVYDASVGIGIDHRHGSAEAKNFTFENIDIEKLSYTNAGNRTWLAFVIQHSPLGVAPVTNVTVKDVNVRDKGMTFAKLTGLEGASFNHVTFDNIVMPGQDKPATNLTEMNILNKQYYDKLKIKPEQTEEPKPRTNLALNQPSVGVEGSAGTAPLAFDGDLTTRFGSARGVDPGWIYVDLGSMKPIDTVKLFWEAAYGKSYQIQISGDAEHWTDVYRTTDGKGGLEEIRFPETEARYVRMYGTQRATQYGYSIYEFEVYGPEN
ncbi:discoidin domain-containing protein [Paenibacillus rigui]|uniref:F5/8 type C domain-containing protein n=1 Tax=Paenibacillus rigui TaxID=554312 RepID=A0A229UI69_9BACL|nr:discoidin domain-containing protein [Paenibacillus rigui]OXM83064.1 hypothetical protein CF651_28030 [Paenibacillus rigui]